jgi:hypothetical protein
MTDQTDQLIVTTALQKAGRILAEYLEPVHRPNAVETLTRLVAVLDNQELATALDRIEKAPVLKVVK